MPTDAKQRNIVTRRKRCERKLDEYSKLLRELREECTHPNAERELKTDALWKDPLRELDRWRECYCDDCGKDWTEEL